MISQTPSLNTSEPEGDELCRVLRDYMAVTQRLQETHERLQREVARLRGELASKDRELERRRRLAALGELAVGVAHEVRNPLGAIQLYSGLLRQQLPPRQEALELIEKIEAGIHAIDCVVQDTLALAPRGGRLERRGMRTIIAEACELCRPILEAAQVTVVVEAGDGALEVEGEPTALARVFVNLIANAAQASPPGAVVRVRIAGEQGQVVVRVLDEGPGVPSEILDRIFDPFFTTKPSGTGLGLTVAHRLVEAHGGTLSAANRAEGGAEFVVVLPTDAQTPEARAARGEQTSAA